MSETIYKVFPAIGIARVGNAPSQFYIGPESYGGLPILPNDPSAPFTPEAFRDDQGRLCRQAARFKIYRSTDGGPYEEVTLDTDDVQAIEWTAHLANKKSSWYRFQTSQGENGYPPEHALRNADKTTEPERLALVIDPGPRSIGGRSASGVHFSRDTIPPGYQGGNFPPDTIKPFAIDTLGELQTDNAGRLLVLGGLGNAGSEIDPPFIAEYANNDGWWDDTSDGPIQATVTLKDSQTIVVEAAWVMVGPPSYAPQIPNLVSLYDTIFDTAIRKQNYCPDIFANGFWNKGEQGYRPNFTQDILPIFERAANYPWVAAIPPKPHTFDYVRLGDSDPAYNGLRHYYLDYIRAPSNPNLLVSPISGVTMMPYLAGDDAIGPSEWASSKYSTLTDTQYFFLKQWADGHFDNTPPPALDPAEALTRAVLENCVGGAFSPGIEMTWISRNPSIYSGPFRIRVRTDIPAPLSLGFEPLLGMEPGDVCRYMAVPWQADFNECSSQPINGRILWWWPAQRPEYVYLPPEPKAKESGPTIDTGRQVAWVGSDYDQNADDYIAFADDLEMVYLWRDLGFVYNIGTEDKPHFVEVMRTLPRR